MQKALRTAMETEGVGKVIAYAKGTTPLRTTPCFVSNIEDVSKAIMSSFCENNLTVYLPYLQDRVAVVVKPCDSRTLKVLMDERQVSRENVYIIGVECNGIIDRKKLLKDFPKALEAEVNDDEIKIKLKDSSVVVVSKYNYLDQFCNQCNDKNPVIYDIKVGEAISNNHQIETKEQVACSDALEKKTGEERYQYFANETSKCIRCYACRNACPLCYCEECFVDQSQPQWIGKTIDESDTAFFHIIRAFHLAGRCVGCGSCSKACPEGIDLKALNLKLKKEAESLYNHKSGVNNDGKHMLSSYHKDDNQEFMVTERLK